MQLQLFIFKFQRVIKYCILFYFELSPQLSNHFLELLFFIVLTVYEFLQLVDVRLLQCALILKFLIAIVTGLQCGDLFCKFFLFLQECISLLSNALFSKLQLNLQIIYFNVTFMKLISQPVTFAKLHFQLHTEFCFFKI